MEKLISKISNLSKETFLGIVLVILFIFMSIFANGFLQPSNLVNMLFQLPEFGILALAMMVVIITAGIELSITFKAALSGVVIALLLTSGIPVPLAIIAGILVALTCGLLNGFFVAIIGVSPILATLGAMVLYEGVILSITKGYSISRFPEGYSFIGNGYVGPIPFSILIFVAIAIVTYVLLTKTKWGRSVYMVGSNPIATNFSGINIKRVLIYVYLYSALLAAISAIIMTSRYNTARVDMGSSYLLQSVAAAVLGGTQIQGGYGKVVGTVYAVCIFQVLSNGLNLLGFPRSIVDLIMGVILIAVLTLNFYSAKLTQKRSVKQRSATTA